MTGRTARDATRTFRATVQAALSCVTPRVVIEERVGRDPGSAPSLISLGRRPIRLAGDSRIALAMTQWFMTVSDSGRRGQWRIHSTGYLYALDDPEGREIAAYHWHPEGRGHVVSPHLHLGAGAGTLRRDLTRAHFPTGRVGIDEVVRFAIDALGVRPIRADWDDVLRRAGAALAE